MATTKMQPNSALWHFLGLSYDNPNVSKERLEKLYLALDQSIRAEQTRDSQDIRIAISTKKLAEALASAFEEQARDFESHVELQVHFVGDSLHTFEPDFETRTSLIFKGLKRKSTDRETSND